MKLFLQGLTLLMLSFLAFGCENLVTETSINEELNSEAQSEVDLTSTSLNNDILGQWDYDGGIFTSFGNMSNPLGNRYELYYGTDDNPFETFICSSRFPVIQHMISHKSGIVTATSMFGSISVVYRPDPIENWDHYNTVISHRSPCRVTDLISYGDVVDVFITSSESTRYYSFSDLDAPGRLFLNFSVDELAPVLASCTSEGSAYFTPYSPHWTPGLWWEREQHVLYFNPPDIIKVTVTTTIGKTVSIITYLEDDLDQIYYSSRKVQNNDQVIGNYYQDIYRDEYGFLLPSNDMRIEIDLRDLVIDLNLGNIHDIPAIESLIENVSISPVRSDLLRDRKYFNSLFLSNINDPIYAQTINKWLNIAMLRELSGEVVPNSVNSDIEDNDYFLNHRWDSQLENEGRYQDTIQNLHLKRWSIRYGTNHSDPYWILDTY